MGQELALTIRASPSQTMYAVEFDPASAGGQVTVTYPFAFAHGDDDDGDGSR